MESDKKLKSANILHKTADYVLLVLGILLFIFALLSGAEQYGGGLHGLIRNSPNALPWLVLLILWFIARKNELWGGILILLAVVGAFVFLVTRGNTMHIFPLAILLIIFIMGSFFVAAYFLRRS